MDVKLAAVGDLSGRTLHSREEHQEYFRNTSGFALRDISALYTTRLNVDLSNSGDHDRAQRRPRNYARAQQLQDESRDLGTGEQPPRVRQRGTERQPTAALPIYGLDTVFETDRRLERIERLGPERRTYGGSGRRLRAADVVYRPRSNSRERYFGGDENRGLTTSYVQDGYDYGALGGIYTVVGRTSVPHAEREGPNGAYDIRATDTRRAFRQYGAAHQEQQYGDTRSFDAVVDLAMSSQQRASSRQNSGFENFDRGSPSGSRQSSGFVYTGFVDTRRSRRDSRTESYVNGDAWSYYSRSQDSERRR
ncbi:uncharacterized protein MYCFIDRAFT_212903 [Pseudocercospora fijiensis CIRAD86]|uniref:Uncharacterized protein n=1 Tax=Pseudocercospora fijiensis (strain CIRAD86) TaxID=383855 RepID=N1Q5X0_PSEFD|nr:uncharacterized protein MYCFIDRAFT_212903 [Pseudocercospora fijiensis CIRAD86]EME87485.1 hypothetical protein MYCFIDRAFT_212903 [Pseudocercospora fijiensis CIRAD86]